MYVGTQTRKIPVRVRYWAASAGTEDDTGTVLYSAVPILAECHYWNIRDSSVCIGMTIRVLVFLTEDDTGTGLSD